MTALKMRNICWFTLLRLSLASQVLALCSLAWAASGNITAVQTDKSRYSPGDPIQFSMELGGTITGTQQIVVQYRHLAEIVDTQTISVSTSSPTWSWNPPTDDYRGYLAEVEVVDNSVVEGQSTIAMDVSSDWARFPRYGFLSEYGFLSSSSMNAVIDNLNRYHINGLQFYDWAHKHHQPLAGTVASPDFSWQDIADRTNYRNTVSGYIDKAHDHNMVAMSYDLVYGADDEMGAADDGVQPEWYLYTDTSHTTKDVHDLPSSWLSDIYLLDPGNTAWQSYIAQRNADAIQAFGFDGWHMDQLGDRGTVYDYYSSDPVDLTDSLGPFVTAMKAGANLADKRMVMNSVGQYGQSGIAATDADFLYTEVWDAHEHYNDLATVIQENNTLSDGQLNSVLAAYVNHDLADSPGTFNAPSVLMTDAVIFAFGGAHIELGEHMLAKPYFPSNNLAMTTELEDDLTHYYDFLVGYQNLLRDGGEFGDNPLTSTNTSVNMWPAQQQSVAVVNKTVGDSEVFHLINFSDAADMNWRDNAGEQPEPTQISGLELRFLSTKRIDKLWAASPDDGGAPTELTFSQMPNGLVTLTLPSLKYWSMLVAEGNPPTGSDNSVDEAYSTTWTNGSNGGTGFGPWQLRAQSTSGGYAGFFRPVDDTEAHHIDNAGATDPGSGSAWASFANKGTGVDKATAYRAFSDSLDGAGDSFSITIENGEVYGRVGLTLRSGNVTDGTDDFSTGARMQLFFAGGDSNYSLVDGSGTLDTGIGWTPFGITAEVTLTGPDSYDLVVWRYDQEIDLSPQQFTFAGRSLAGAGTIDSLALFQYDTAGGGIQDDVFFNHLSYTLADSFALLGDYNEDGIVDAADYTVWRDNLGSSTALPNDDTPGVDLGDYDRWRAHFGETASSGSATALGSQQVVPEPTTLCLCSVVALGLGAMRSLCGGSLCGPCRPIAERLAKPAAPSRPAAADSERF